MNRDIIVRQRPRAATRVTYHRLNLDARDTIRWSGVSIADYIRRYAPDGDWRGDRCGCPDDRCIDHHHDQNDDCLCLPATLDEMVGPTP
jgi:hypothetical protein